MCGFRPLVYLSKFSPDTFSIGHIPPSSETATTLLSGHSSVQQITWFVPPTATLRGIPFPSLVTSLERCTTPAFKLTSIPHKWAYDVRHHDNMRTFPQTPNEYGQLLHVGASSNEVCTEDSTIQRSTVQHGNCRVNPAYFIHPHIENRVKTSELHSQVLHDLQQGCM